MSATVLCLYAIGSCLRGAGCLPPAAPWGFLHQPAYSVDALPRPPLEAYHPQPGDLFLLSDVNLIWRIGYAAALSGKPGHCALVVRMPSGELGALEAGFQATTYTRVVPLQEKFATYGGTIWVRRRRAPLTPEQCACLTHFAAKVDGGRYALVRLALQVTPLRSRGPLRTRFLGKSRGFRNRYMCAEAVLEALIYAGLLDKETSRPSATFPRDMFFDSSPNHYIDRHLDLRSCWEVPRLWSGCVNPVGSIGPGFTPPALYSHMEEGDLFTPSPLVGDGALAPSPARGEGVIALPQNSEGR